MCEEIGDNKIWYQNVAKAYVAYWIHWYYPEHTIATVLKVKLG